MKRAPFLGTAAAAMLAGCGGNHVMRALPGVSATNGLTKNASAVGLVPQAADPIPDTVLAHPLLGEAARFDGATPPGGWVFAQGQMLEVNENRALFSVLGAVAGGDGRTTFALPKYRFGVIVAIAGTLMTSPAMLAQSVRRVSLTGSLGPGARPTPPRAPKPPRPEVAAAQRRLSSSPRVGPGAPTSIPPDLDARILQSANDARTDATGRLSAANQARLENAVASAANGSVGLIDAVRQIAGSLSSEEASAALEVHDRRMRAFRDRWVGVVHADPRQEAARFLVSVAMTPEQVQAMNRRQP